MKRLILGFLGAVLVPCGVLAWLSVRALREEQKEAERRQVALAHEKDAHTTLLIKQKVASLQQKWEATMKSEFLLHGPADAPQKSAITPEMPISHVILLDLETGIVPQPDLAANEGYQRLIQEESPFLQGTQSMRCYYSVPPSEIPLPMLAFLNPRFSLAAAGFGGGGLAEKTAPEADFLRTEDSKLREQETISLDAEGVAMAPKTRRELSPQHNAPTPAPLPAPGKMAKEEAPQSVGGLALQVNGGVATPPGMPGAGEAGQDLKEHLTEHLGAPEALKAKAAPMAKAAVSELPKSAAPDPFARRGVSPSEKPGGTATDAIKKPAPPPAPSAAAPTDTGPFADQATPPAQPNLIPTEVALEKARDRDANRNARSSDKSATREKQMPLRDSEKRESEAKTAAPVSSEFSEIRRVSAQHPTPEQLASAGSISTIKAADVTFEDLWSVAESGSFARQLENGEMRLAWWVRSSQSPLICLAYVDIPRLSAVLETMLPKEDPDFFHTLIDPLGSVLNSNLSAATTTAQPFASQELGLVLPKWETAIFLRDPTRLLQVRQSAQWQLGLPLLAVLAAAVAGAWLLWADAARQRRDARTKTDFVSQVSHELRTPLTSIRMFSDLLAKASEPDLEKTKKYAAIISDESSRLSRLVDQVLDFSRIERGTLDLTCRTLDLNNLVSETVQSYLPQLESQGFAVHIDATPTPIPVTADPDRMAQLILNLLNNAEKYGASATREIDIEIRSNPNPQIAIQDRGPGIPKGEEKRIFEKFHRANNNLDNPVNGSGLGLALAREIARAHGGDLTYQPREGGGSVFLVSLPKGNC